MFYEHSHTSFLMYMVENFLKAERNDNTYLQFQSNSAKVISNMILCISTPFSEELSCLTLCNPMNHSLPGSSVLGILQARILEWVAVLFSRGPSQSRDQTLVSHIAGGLFYHLSHQRSPHSLQPCPSSHFPTSSPKVSVTRFTNFGPPDRYEILSYCSLNLFFFDN